MFLRHFGCTFCREAMAEITELRPSIEGKGTQPAFIHLSPDDSKAHKFFTPNGLEQIPRISDPDGRLYDAFGLTRAHWRQYINSESIRRTFATWLRGKWPGPPAGDVERMPGVFLLVNGKVRKFFRHKLVSDRSDYLSLTALGQ